ncbi:hypothetical protein ACJ72_01079 [Emergomyces africanus]|uniref:CFEM domain-containing protein n=1 Tax=Emergomyces africanus TaxID=1955775 RepID=A0A1B7P6A7_9EURO|nr:hypothetical protein ACJ72_01079 [Emergomyces africanus]
MKATLSVVAILAVLIQQTNATFSWDTNKFFPNPSNCDNKCSDNQKSGFDWKALALGPFSSFGDFDFSGFTCGERKPPKSNFQNKCIQGNLLKGAANGSPEISYGKSKAFSIISFQITVDEDTDISFLYTMPDGSTCKHTTPCTKGGSEVQNTQCGGAVSVKFGLPLYSKLNDCGFAIHKIDFDCEPSEAPSKPVVVPTNEISTYPTLPTADPESGSQSYPASSPQTTQVPESYTVTPPSETNPPETPPESTPPGSTPPESTPPESTPPGTAPPESTPPESTPPGTAPPVVVPPESTPPQATPTPTDVISYSTSTVFTTTMITVTSCAPQITSCPADSTTIITSTIAISTTICPITITPTSPNPIVTVTTSGTPREEFPSFTPNYPTGSLPPPTPPPITDPPVPGSATPSPSSALPTADSSSPPRPPLPPATPSEAPCPKVLPQCLNTWLKLVPKCGSNSDISCFCPSSDFTSAVIACIQSWGISNDEIQHALFYFTGICAAHIPKNPGIITAIPQTITLSPPPAPTLGPSIVTSPPQAPLTTITVFNVVTVSGTKASTLSTVVTIPQVQFITETIADATTGANVGLVPGTTAFPEAFPTENPPSYPTPTQASTFATIPLPSTDNQTLNPFTGAGVGFLSAIPSTLWILSAVTVVRHLLH